MSKQFKDQIKHLSISLEKGQNNREILDLFTTEFRQLKMNISGKLLIKFPTHWKCKWLHDEAIKSINWTKFINSKLTHKSSVEKKCH